jgi:predicted short-subunit dehydrogenase-like oxidoreductase (DUF2520 family)
MKPMRIVVAGRGKVGTALAAGWRRAGHHVRLVSARARVPSGDLLILAVSDGAIGEVATKLALATRRSVHADPPCWRAVAHCAGSLGPEALAPLRKLGFPVAQMHPLSSFASLSRHTPIAGGYALVQGDARAVRIVSRSVRALGLRPVTPASPVDPTLYHAAAAIASNGSVALVAVAAELLAAAGLDSRLAAKMLAALLASSAWNIGALGLPDALTGPIRRADVATVERHLTAIGARLPGRLPLIRELARAQLAMARAASPRATSRAMSPRARTKSKPKSAAGQAENYDRIARMLGSGKK